jgi:hypothetical protein
MKQGSILGRIAKEISLSDYADDTPLSVKIDGTIKAAIPADVYDWFIGEIAPPPLSNSQGLKLLGWLFKNIKRAELDLKHIALIRQARREQFIEAVKEHLPTVATMAHVTEDHLSNYIFEEGIATDLVPYLSHIIKRDVETITVSLQWSMKDKAITIDDCKWMMRYCKPVSEYTQLLLI